MSKKSKTKKNNTTRESRRLNQSNNVLFKPADRLGHYCQAADLTAKPESCCRGVDVAIAVSQDKREASCGQLLYLARVWWKYGQKEEYSTCYIMVEIPTEGRVQHVLYHCGNTDRRKSTVT